MAYLHENLLSVAECLLDLERVGTAARRRAISTAYYAVFRRLSSLCAASLAPAPLERDAYEAVLRSLNHKKVAEILKGAPAKELIGEGVGVLFGELLSAREWADYSSASHVGANEAKNDVKLTRVEAAKYLTNARVIIAAVDTLDERARHKLAILLAFPKR